MRALSIKNPWAYAILELGKTVENRTWSTNHRGPVLVHTGKRQDVPARAWIESKGLVVPEDLLTGGIVGVVDIVDVVEDHPSRWAMAGHFHWVLENPRPLPFVELTGKLGIWETGLEIGTIGLVGGETDSGRLF